MQNIRVDCKHTCQGHKSSIYVLEIFDENFFLSSGGDGYIVKWDLTNPDLGLVVASIGTQVFSMVYDKHESIIYAGDMNGGLHVVSLKDGSLNRSIQMHQKGIFKLAITDNKLISLGADGKVRVYEPTTLRSLETIQLSRNSLRSLSIDHYQNKWYIGCSDGNIYYLDANNYQLLETISLHASSVFTLLLESDYLFSGGRDAQLICSRLDDRSIKYQLPAHWYTINAMAKLSKLGIFATASRDKTFKLWSMDGSLLKVIDAFKEGHVNSINDLLWFDNHNLLITASDDKTLKLWRITTN